MVCCAGSPINNDQIIIKVTSLHNHALCSTSLLLFTEAYQFLTKTQNTSDVASVSFFAFRSRTWLRDSDCQEEYSCDLAYVYMMFPG